MTTPRNPRYFPPAESANEDGLVLFGGRLSPDWLLDAYRHGIFPWPIFEDASLLAWWSPDPRAIIEFEEFHIPRSLHRICRSGKFQLTCNRAFAQVIHGCANVPDRRGKTWLSDQMIAAYLALHELGHAHSVEAWYDDTLAGGVYGVSVGGLFAAESMFFRVADASKVALVALVEHLRVRGYKLLDIQQLTEHTQRFGAREISRRMYLKRLAAAIELPVTFGKLVGSGDV